METTKTRYANAMFSIALEKNKVVEYQKEAKEILRVLNMDEDFVQLLDCSFLPLSTRLQQIDIVFKNKICDDMLATLKVIVKNNKAKYLLEILQEFSSECNENLDVMEGIIYSTEKLDAKKIHAIEDVIAKKENKKVELLNKISPNIIGGIKVVINDHVYDGSLASKLEGLRKKLMN